MIIDIRCRLPERGSDAYFNRSPVAVTGSTQGDDSDQAFLQVLDGAHVDVAVSPSGHNPGMQLGRLTLPDRTTSNGELAAFEQRHPDRFIAVAGIDVGNRMHDSQAELTRCIDELGMKAVTIEPGRAPLYVPHPADRRLYDFYAQLESRQIPLILQTSGLKGGKSLDYAHPKWIDQIAEDFPELRLICAHACTPFAMELAYVLGRREHVYAAPDLYVFLPGGSEWVEIVNRTPWAADKFLFGSAYPLCGNLAKFVRRFLDLPWKEKVLDRIMYRNAIRALNLQDGERFRALLAQPDLPRNAWPHRRWQDSLRRRFRAWKRRGR